jgi:hypothetical protein
VYQNRQQSGRGKNKPVILSWKDLGARIFAAFCTASPTLSRPLQSSSLYMAGGQKCVDVKG